ncbi:MAG TPA: AAA family ATPase, partial [Thermodesulfobacteriota bacterium]|nr:AAA family ATPase [Thermodesulfobacteriota bacterium]
MTGEHASIAKITRPRSARIFVRKRLFRLLDTCRKYPVIWIAGPAGSGKTTLVSSYLDSNKLPCLWYQVDEGDSDSATFFSYMGTAARRAAPRIQAPLPLLTPEYLRGISIFTLRYFENLFSRFKVPYVFVFDNYHAVPADSSFHTLISDGLNAIPEGMNVIIISRHDLPPALSRLLANGLIRMLGWDELRLRLGESGGIVKLRERGKAPKEMIRRLHDATDGWAAGLVLMLESLKTGIEPHLLGKLTQRQIVDYFGNELFSKIEKEMQDFLLHTAFLPRMTAKMAEKLTGLSSADRILSTLNRDNYFTEKHYSAEPFYQYHPLLREFLIARARETFSDETLSKVLRRAALLLEEAGQTEAALSLFRDLGDWRGMVQLIMKQAPSMLEHGRYRPLGEWLDSLPEEILENDPWLLYWKGTSRFPFDPSLAQPYLERAFEQ